MSKLLQTLGLERTRRVHRAHLLARRMRTGAVPGLRTQMLRAAGVDSREHAEGGRGGTRPKFMSGLSVAIGSANELESHRSRNGVEALRPADCYGAVELTRSADVLRIEEALERDHVVERLDTSRGALSADCYLTSAHHAHSES